jgi:hypothetical protein
MRESTCWITTRARSVVLCECGALRVTSGALRVTSGALRVVLFVVCCVPLVTSLHLSLVCSRHTSS